MSGDRNRTESGIIIGILVSSIVLNSTTIQSPELAILRGVTGFFLITVLPGYIILSTVRLGSLSSARVAVYTLGVSLLYTLGVAIVLNFLFPIVGGRIQISRRLVIGLAVPVLAIWFVAPHRTAEPHRTTEVIPSLHRTSAKSVSFLALVTLLPIYAAVSTYIVNVTGYTMLMIPLLLAIAIIPLLCIRWRLPAWAVPYIIWTVSLAVLWHMTLVSWHLWGWDIHYQYHVATIIYNANSWSLDLAMSSNSLISITLLAAIYSTLTGLEIVWVYKIVYPILASLVPVGGYLLFDRVFSDREVVTLAPFVLIFYYGFFKDMPDKQLIALLFVIMFLAAVMDDQLSRRSSHLLGGLFGVGVVVSHYGVSLLLFAFLGFTYATVFVLRRYDSVEITTRIAPLGLILFLGGFWLCWFAFTAAGVNLESIIEVGYSSVLEIISGSTERSGADYATQDSQSIAWLVYQLLYIGLIGLIGIGIAASGYSAVFGSQVKVKRQSEFVVFSVGVFVFLCTSVLVTFGMGFDRTLQIALIVLSPYAILGLQIVSSVLTIVTSIDVADRFTSTGQLFAVFLLLLFLFSSGIGFAAIDGEQPAYNIALDRDAGWPVYDQSEVSATRWIETQRGSETVALFNRWQMIKSRDGLLLSEVLFDDQMESVWEDQESVDEASYIYLSEKPMTEPESDTAYIDSEETVFYRQNVIESNKIYHSGEATVYYVR